MRTVLLARDERPVHDGGADVVVNNLTRLPTLASTLVHNRMAHAA
jgi:hypothetical protein